MTRRALGASAGVVAALAMASVVASREVPAGTAYIMAPAGVPRRDLEIAAWTNALDTDPESSIALAQLGGLHLQRARETGSSTDIQRAEGYARRSLALRVNRNAKTYVTLATALVAQHRFSEAEAVARRAVAYDPAVPEYRALLAEVKMELGEYEGAQPLFESLAPFTSSLSVAPRLSRWAELNGETEKAYIVLRNAVTRAAARRDIPKEQLAWFHYRLGDLEMRRGRFRRAKREFGRGLMVEPGDYRILSAMAKLALLEGKHRTAIDLAERALFIHVDPATLGILADAQAATGNREREEESIRAMEVAVRGQQGAYHRDWSLFLLDRGRRLDEVRRSAEKELETRKDIYGYDVLAWSLYRLGIFEEAATNMDRALQLGTRDPVILYHAGMIEKARGNEAAAKTHLEKALAINARFDARQAPLARETLRNLE